MPGDVVFLVELVFGEHSQENVLGQDVLNQHFLNVELRHLGADGTVAKLQKAGGGGLVVVAFGGVPHGLAQGGQDVRQVFLELIPRRPEFLDLPGYVIEERLYEPVQLAGIAHIGLHCDGAALEQDRGAGILKDDVVVGIAAAVACSEFGVQIVVQVFASQWPRDRRIRSLTVPSGMTPPGARSSGTSSRFSRWARQ